MKKFYLLAIIFAISICSLYSNEQIKQFRTNEIIVISEDKQIQKSTSANDFEIDGKHRNKYFSLDALFNEINGIRSARNSKNEGYFRLRGMDQRQIGIYFDGIPIVNQYDGMVDLSQYSLTAVSKISIAKGLSSALYGANNLGGSINIITDNVFARNSVGASINYGDISQNIGLKAKHKFGDFYLTLAADYNNFDNFKSSSLLNRDDKTINNSYGKSYSGFVKLANQIGNSFIHSLSVMYGNGEKGIPINLETTKPRYWKMPNWNNLIANYGTNALLSDIILLKTNIFATKSHNIIDSYDDSSYTTQKTRSAFHSTQEYLKFGGSAILEINWQNFEQTKFAITFNRDKQNQQANSPDPWKDFRSQLLSVSAEQNFGFGNFGGLIGLNYDLLTPIYANGSNLRNSEDFLNYQLGLNYSTVSFNVYGNYSHKSRFPTLKEFYAEITGANKPNPNLQSEFAENLELGVRTSLIDNLNIRTSIYANFVKNLIDITILEDKSRQFVNIGKVLFAGLELDVNYQIYDVVFNFGFNYQKSENQTDGATSKIMPLRPEFVTNFSMSHSFDFGLSALLQLKSYLNHQAYNSDKKTYFELPNYNLLNAVISYDIMKNISLNSALINILDELYYSDWGYPQAGFSFNLGVGINL